VDAGVSDVRATVDGALVDLRPFMAGFPTGVGVVTALDGHGDPYGMTCTSMCGVTLDPPTVLVCLREGSATLRALRSRGRFALNLLHEGGRATAELFGSGDPRRFERVPWLLPDGSAGPHLVEASQSTADCEVAAVEVVGSHGVVFGRVTRIVQHRVPRPLLYGLRQFRAWPETS
jgi:flavin reductase (DIM6/NTAB) family NADH-FMN oxidoreductase RutF